MGKLRRLLLLEFNVLLERLEIKLKRKHFSLTDNDIFFKVSANEDLNVANYLELFHWAHQNCKFCKEQSKFFHIFFICIHSLKYFPLLKVHFTLLIITKKNYCDKPDK